MKKHQLSAFAVAALGAGLFLGSGCEKAADKPAVPSNPPAPVPQAATPASGTMTMSTPAGTGTVTMSAPTATGTMTSSANAVSATSTADAQKLLDQATQYIKENKWELADSTLKQLEAMKASLPADWAPRIDQARQAFTMAKSGSNMVPSMPAMPK